MTIYCIFILPNTNSFIESLRKELRFLPEEEIKDIIYDYEEHFQIGISKGKTEEEICKELGNPKNIAKSYRATYKIDLAEKNPSTKNLFTAIIAAISLGFFNLVFVLGPFLGLIGILFGIYGIGLAFVAAGGKVLLGMMIFNFYSYNMHPITQVSFGIGFISLGLLILIGCFYLTKYLYSLTIRYLRWNIKLITK